MSEILQIFHQSPPSHHEMHPRIQRSQVNVESQFDLSIDSGFMSPGIFDVTDQFQCSEFAGSPLMNFSSSPVDELSMLTAIIEQNQSSRKRKLENVECDSELVGSPKAKRSINNGNSNPKMDTEPTYVHVRARRGQATDSHSLAERARREKIKRKMQFLQDLVPGCNKLTNKAAILDEIISYIQCLQRDVEFLNLKLAATTTSVDLQMDDSLPEELPQWQ